MTVIFRPAALLCHSARKRFGKRCTFGFGMFGQTMYGQEPIDLILKPFGACLYGDTEYAEYIELSGVYADRTMKAGRGTIKMPMYVPKNPRTPPTQAVRDKFKLAVASWRVLTTEQKARYTTRAVGHTYTGYNLKISEYMLS